MSIHAETFEAWFNANLADQAEDIANHGADSGFSGITYTSDTVELYNKFEGEIWEALCEDAHGMGYSNPIELVVTFKRSDMLSDPDTFKNLLVWYMAERIAQRMTNDD
jgi:hypothetical protein